jgi:hypothetical protein
VRERRKATVIEARLAQTIPQDGTLGRCDTCGATFLDHPDGRDAHVVVFGHTPSRKEESA